jgi:hypothetical protein
MNLIPCESLRKDYLDGTFTKFAVELSLDMWKFLPKLIE